MKVFLAFFLAVASAFTVAFSTPITVPQTSPAHVEYNLSGCKAQGYDVYHIEIDGGKLAFTWHLAGPGVVEKNPPAEHIVLDYVANPMDAEGDVIYHAKGKRDGHVIELNGLVNGKYMMGFALADAELSAVVYGKEGSLDDLAKEHTGPENDPDYKFCVSLQDKPVRELPRELGIWLKNQENSKGAGDAGR